ncbi:MAG: metalloregulator ArsR/SmtB family transcription factor [Spirochaetaceae bacterium]|nr:metalloregulator ArsR/SmtB family transcription factor [Spirochaetaceae bacterium]
MPHPADTLCSCAEEHPEAIARARTQEWPVQRLLALAELFKMLADPGRLRIVNALSAGQRLCVCDLATLLGVSQSALSHQLAILRRARLVRPERAGKVVYYQLDDKHVQDLVALALEHVSEQGVV